jgi:hypothetical protein
MRQPLQMVPSPSKRCEVVRNACVPKEGLEPSHPKAQDPKSCVSTNSTTPANRQVGDGVYRRRSRLSLSTWPLAFTLYCATAMVPWPFLSTSMTKVERITPSISLP